MIFFSSYKKITYLFFLLLFPTFIISQNLTSSSNLDITKTWYQEPNGYTYSIDIDIPNLIKPDSGYPVTILLHGAGGFGAGIINTYRNIIPCNILIAPNGYMNSWNIAQEASNAPDIEMIDELIYKLQQYDNINPNKINILGTSNGSALANRILIENKNSGIDIICAIVSHLTKPQFHNDNFYSPTDITDCNLPFCGYDSINIPLTGRKYLNIANVNDPVIPYYGGFAFGIEFLNAEDAVFTIANSQGYTGNQIQGTILPNTMHPIYEFSYLNNQVVMINATSVNYHYLNEYQKNYISDFFNCNYSSSISDRNLNYNRKKIKIVNFLGKEILETTKNQILFYLYDDGTVEKKINFK